MALERHPYLSTLVTGLVLGLLYAAFNGRDLSVLQALGCGLAGLVPAWVLLFVFRKSDATARWAGSLTLVILTFGLNVVPLV